MPHSSGAGSQDIDDDELATADQVVETPKPDEAHEITSQLFSAAPQLLDSEGSESKAQDIASEIPAESTDKPTGDGSDVLDGSKPGA
jgi:hypothetical protein